MGFFEELFLTLTHFIQIKDADDVDVPKPEEKSIMTYVAQFLHKYPEPKVS